MTLIALMMLAADPSGDQVPEILLLDFTASYCQPCQQMVPVIQRMEKSGFPIRRIDTTEHPDIMLRYNVDRIPTFILLVNGKETQRLTGIQSERELRRIMTDAWDRLHPRDTSADPPVPATAEHSREERSGGGLRGILARLRSGLSGRKNGSGFRHPTFRAQNPDPAPAVHEKATEKALAATVRVRVKSRDGSKEDVGTGSILHSTTGESIILTCAHLFRETGRNPKTEVDVFRNGRVLSYPARIVRGDHYSDLAILQIQNRNALPTVSLASLDQKTPPNTPAFSMGCDHGEEPSSLSVKIVDLNRYDTNVPPHLVCSTAPRQGRSGGGLFNAAGQLIGVCSCADYEQKEGLYMARQPILDLFRKAKLTHVLTQSDEQSPAAIPSETPRPDSESSDDDLIASIFGSEETDSDPAVTETVETEAAARDTPSPNTAPDHVDDFHELTAISEQAVRDAATDTDVEVTVIVESRSGSFEKEMIVIRRPTPWLLELLTGRAGASGQVASVRKPAPPGGAGWIHP